MNSPVHPHIQRTLAAIVVTDAVGFSRCMSQDEDRALAMINRDLQLIGELCEFFEGQILKTVGDGVLMYFVSAVQAAACAVEMQKTFARFANIGKGNEHFTHRVGVHLGDIFVNQQDMMGTGVNIAARLESASKPGAICMSQVVYDVVKSRLDLDASYLGKLSLKNIEGGIAAYHVWPVGTRLDATDEDAAKDVAEEEAEEITEAIAPLVITPLNAALQTLSVHPNRRRIIKLLYAAHKATWENNTAILESIPLKALLASLADRNPVLQDCRQSLYQIVRTLNRQEEYAQVAEVILESLKPFYTKSTLRPTLRSTVETTTAYQEGDDSGLQEMPRRLLYHDIADQIDQMSENIRMKKVLYCLCYDSWENDSDCIATIKTATLIETLYQQVTTLQGLQKRLRAILLRLNHKAKYAPIADTIFRTCQALYPEAGSQMSQISMPGAPDIIKLEETTAEDTQINLRRKTTTRWTTAKKAASNLMVSPVLMRATTFENDASQRSIHPIK